MNEQRRIFSVPVPDRVQDPGVQPSEYHEADYEDMLEHVVQHAKGVGDLIGWYDETRTKKDPHRITTALDAATTRALQRVPQQAVEAASTAVNFYTQRRAVERNRLRADLEHNNAMLAYEDVDDEDPEAYEDDEWENPHTEEIIELDREHRGRIAPLMANIDTAYATRVLLFQRSLSEKVRQVAEVRDDPTRILDALNEKIQVRTTARLKPADIRRIHIEAQGIYVEVTPEAFERSRRSGGLDAYAFYLRDSIFSVGRPTPAEDRFLSSLFGEAEDTTERHEGVHNLIDDLVEFIPSKNPLDLFEVHYRTYIATQQYGDAEVQRIMRRSLLSSNEYLHVLHNEFLAEFGAKRMNAFHDADYQHAPDWATAEARLDETVMRIRLRATHLSGRDEQLSRDLNMLANTLVRRFAEVKQAGMRIFRLAEHVTTPEQRHFLQALPVVIPPERYRHIERVIRHELGDAFVEEQLWELDVRKTLPSLSMPAFMRLYTQRMGRLTTAERIQRTQEVDWADVFLSRQRIENGFCARNGLTNLSAVEAAARQVDALVPPEIAGTVHSPALGIIVEYLDVDALTPLLRGTDSSCDPRQIAHSQQLREALLIAFERCLTSGQHYEVVHALIPPKKTKLLPKHIEQTPLGRFLDTAGLDGAWQKVVR